MKSWVTGAIVAVLVVATAGAGFLGGYYSRGTIITTSVTTFTTIYTQTRTTTMTSITTYFTNGSSPSLELIANLSPASFVSGHNVTISYDIYNPLSVQISQDVSSYANPPLWACGGNEPATIKIFQGAYDYSNMSMASPLMLYNASEIPLCPAQSSAHFIFQPNSDQAEEWYTAYQSPPFSRSMNDSYEFSGYYVQASQGSPYTFQHFQQGTYTVLVYDVWGQQRLLYFQVS